MEETSVVFSMLLLLDGKISEVLVCENRNLIFDALTSHIFVHVREGSFVCEDRTTIYFSPGQIVYRALYM